MVGTGDAGDQHGRIAGEDRLGEAGQGLVGLAEGIEGGWEAGQFVERGVAFEDGEGLAVSDVERVEGAQCVADEDGARLGEDEGVGVGLGGEVAAPLLLEGGAVYGDEGAGATFFGLSDGEVDVLFIDGGGHVGEVDVV